VADLLTRPCVYTGQSPRTLTAGAGENTLPEEAEIAPGTARVFIYPTVAVVVDAVTGLGRGHPTGAALVEQPFVGLTITIVIDIVADLFRRADGAVAHQGPPIHVTGLGLHDAAEIIAAL